MNGNIDPGGIAKDLDWFSRVGVGGVQIFEGGMGAPQVIPDRVVSGSPKWFDLLADALIRARDLGLEVSLTPSAGWSLMGAPWVKEQDAMKKIVWSETLLDENQIEIELKPLPSIPGPFQDAAMWGEKSNNSFAKDYVCLAVRDTGQFTPIKPEEIEISREFKGTLDALLDGSWSSWIEIDKDVTSFDEVNCTYKFENPTLFGSATIGISGPNGFGSPELPAAFLQGSNDGINFLEIAEFPTTTSMGQLGEIPAKTISFDPVKFRFVRLVLKSKPMADALPIKMQGVSDLPFKPELFDKFLLSEFTLFPGGKVHGFEYKAGYSIHTDYASLKSGTNQKISINFEEVIDVTKHLNKDSSILDWQAPEGKWRIFRLGYSLTGSKNGPAPAEATGLEVDKLDKSRVQKYLHKYFHEIFSALEIRGISEDAIAGILCDSIESKAQNFTETIAEEFLARRGYSMEPWLLTLTGWVVASDKESDKFLYDFRKTISDLLADSVYESTREFAQSRSAILYSEALESHRPQLGDDLEMRSHADIPMGAMWTWPQEQLPVQTYLADVKGASSVTHVYGRKATGCESFSTYGYPFAYSPSSLKKVADLELALGVTLFNIHSSPLQPDQIPGPGMTLAPTLGQVFTRNETWAESARPWVDYLSRCSYLLSQGRPVAPILYYVGDESPVTATWGSTYFDVPSGYDFDFISTPGLMNIISAKSGQIFSEEGQYQLLYLGGDTSCMSVPVLEKILFLLDNGIKVAGKIPGESPGLFDGQVLLTQLVNRLENHKNFYCVNSLGEAISRLHLSEDWIFYSGEVALDSTFTPKAEIRCIHRRGDDFDLYFVANARDESRILEMELSSARTYCYIVDAVSKTISEKPEATANSLELSPFGSIFVLFLDSPLPSEWTQSAPCGSKSELLLRSWQANVGDFSVTVEGTFDWTSEEYPDEVRYFSGTAFLVHTLEITEPLADSGVYLELEAFGEIVDVWVNDCFEGTMWAKGQKLQILNLTQGFNKIELRITNNWRNRVLGDQYGKARFSSQNKTFISYPIFEPDASLMNSGLLGEARLVMHR